MKFTKHDGLVWRIPEFSFDWQLNFPKFDRKRVTTPHNDIILNKTISPLNFNYYDNSKEKEIYAFEESDLMKWIRKGTLRGSIKETPKSERRG